MSALSPPLACVGIGVHKPCDNDTEYPTFTLTIALLQVFQ